MELCLGLAASGTHTGALEWMRQPLAELAEWAEAAVALRRRQEGKKHEILASQRKP